MAKQRTAHKPCYHCHEAVFTEQRYQLNIQGEELIFCCPACLSITQTIIEAGLSDYYQQRESAAPTPSQGSFTLWDNPDLQSDFVTYITEEQSPSERVNKLHTALPSQNKRNLAKAKLYIEGMHCSTCAWLIERTLLRQKGIKYVHVNFSQEYLSVEWDINSLSLSSLMSSINSIGYTPHPFQEDTVKKLQLLNESNMLKRLGILGILMMQIGMLSIALYAGSLLGINAHYENLLRTFTLLVSLPVLYYGALPFLSRSMLNLKNKQLGMDVNVALAITGLFISSTYAVIYKEGEIYFDSVAMLCFFILLARFIEQKSRVRLRNHSTFLPKFAHKIINETTKNTLLNDLQHNDIIRIQQGETIPVDGIIQAGQSTVSESILTGESKAIQKKIGDTVLAGSQNHDGEIDIRVENKNADTLVKNIERFLQRPDNNQRETNTLTNQLAHHFSGFIIILSLACFTFWYVKGNPNAYWIALSVLVVSCPCALSLAAPTALSAIQAKLRQQGILIQSSTTIENLSHIDHVIFDKTGTLTTGEFTISQIKNLSTHTQDQLIYLASRLEASSKHPISKAFNPASNIALNTKIFLHLGVQGEIEQTPYRIGSVKFCQQWHPNTLPPALPNQDSMTQAQWIGLCDKHSLLAWFLLEDRLRDHVSSSINYLQESAIKVSLVSGDQEQQVSNTANALGVTRYYSQQSSFKKLETLEHLQQESPYILTIGDGINDAPLLSASYMSATFSNACDWVKNSSDIIFLNKSLKGIEQLLTANQRYKHILKQNFIWAIGYNIIAIPFAMMGFVTPWMAAIGMSVSSLMVVLNSYRLSQQT